MVFIAVALIGCACAIFLTCRTTGQISGIRWMPDPIGHWADQHGRVRNFPAYFLLTCPFLLLFRNAFLRIRAVVLVGSFGTVLELTQYFVPARMVEWQDIAFSWAGVVAAWLLFEGVHRGLERFGSKAPCDQPSSPHSL